MAGLKELRKDMTKGTDRVDERAHNGHEKLRDELADAISQVNYDQALLAQKTDQYLADSLSVAARESEERERKIMQKKERLQNNYDETNSHTMTNLESRLDAKANPMMQKLDDFFE